MCEGIDGVAALEPAVISVLELFMMPFTGASSYTAALALRKHVVNGLLDKAGLPIPRFAAIRRGDPLVSVGFPAIVKPAAEDASLGVSQQSVVRTMRQLAERVGAMLELWDEVLVQRYVDGREVNVGVLGDAVLPISEIDFGKMPRGRWRIVTYQSKWEPGSVDDVGGEPRCPARLPAKVAQEIRRVALGAWKLVDGFGYGRVDMRVDAAGRPWILEVNANPDIAPDAGLARMASWICSPRRRRIPRRPTRPRRHAHDRMQMPVKLGALQRGHRNRIREILDATSVFRDEEVRVALELFDETFAAGPARAPYDPGDGVANYEFVGSFSREGQLVGYVCYGATPGTDRTYDLYWIAMHPEFQGSGGGSQLLDEVERRLRQREARLLVVETSSRDDYAPTRHFYETRGYTRAASLADFYSPGDARIIYTKRLTRPLSSSLSPNAESSRNE